MAYFNELALFAGGGGGLLASKLLRWNTIAACEIHKPARDILFARQRDGLLERFPIWDDVSTFKGKHFRGLVDIITGGFPCQDVSSAGKGLGVGEGDRSGLWKEYARIVQEVEPSFVFAENSPLLDRRGLSIVLQDLSRMGYDARWCVLGAGLLGGAHQRDRIWVLAHSNKKRIKLSSQRTEKNLEIKVRRTPSFINSSRTQECGRWLLDQSFVSRKPDDVAKWVDRFEAIGNGQVSIVAAVAFSILSKGWL